MVMGSAQRNALNKTALGTANALTNWSALLVAEMEKQGVGRYRKETREGEKRQRIFGKVTTDDKETVTFERWQIRRVLDEMDSLKQQLLRFETSVTK
jgi:protein gp37